MVVMLLFYVSSVPMQMYQKCLNAKYAEYVKNVVGEKITESQSGWAH